MKKYKTYMIKVTEVCRHGDFLIDEWELKSSYGAGTVIELMRLAFDHVGAIAGSIEEDDDEY